MTKHTPAPLFVHDFTEIGGTVDVSCDHPATITVATMGSGLTGTHEEKLANAHLFAQAPAMRDALASLLRFHPCDAAVSRQDWLWELLEAWKAARDVLARVDQSTGKGDKS